MFVWRPILSNPPRVSLEAVVNGDVDLEILAKLNSLLDHAATVDALNAPEMPKKGR